MVMADLGAGISQIIRVYGKPGKAGQQLGICTKF